MVVNYLCGKPLLSVLYNTVHMYINLEYKYSVYIYTHTYIYIHTHICIICQYVVHNQWWLMLRPGVVI